MLHLVQFYYAESNILQNYRYTTQITTSYYGSFNEIKYAVHTVCNKCNPLIKITTKNIENYQ